jgi:hypothetical protein
MIALFLAGLFFANGLPHFVNGISGREFHNPSLHRFFPALTSPLFNVIWGLLNFGLMVILLTMAEIITPQPEAVLFAAGFTVASIGLAIFFRRFP